MSDQPRLTVREMRLDEVDLRIDYFHDASDEYLRALGVDRALLPARQAWRARYEEDYARPIRQRLSYLLAWELAGDMVGFSSTDRIEYGEQAFMHLHIVREPQRRSGFGAEFVKQSAATYFRVLELQRLYCEPNAFNVAPNRTLQRAGFTYLFSHEAAPSSINFMQATTRWVLDRPSAVSD
jgi:RimJ/RimL family protein N-acetyltransferase